MGDVVDLHGQPAHHDDDELISDLARFADGTLSEAAVKSRHRLTDAEWASLGEDDALVRAIEAEKLRRIRSGQTKRERAAIEIIDGPPILGKLMRSTDTNARHVIDAIKTLDALAANGPEAAAAGTRFSIVINLGTDSEGKEIVERYDRSIKVDPNDRDPHDPNPTSQVFPVITTKKIRDDDDGEGHF